MLDQCRDAKISVDPSSEFTPVISYHSGRHSSSITDNHQLYHATCAITLLSLALMRQSSLFPVAFRHYHLAVVACRPTTSTPRKFLINLHSIHLMCGTCCASQKHLADSAMWSIHFQKLADLAYTRDRSKMERSQAYILQYTLLLDAQCCLTGNLEAGSFIRAFLAHNTTFPDYHMSDCPGDKAISRDMVRLAIIDLNRGMCSKYISLSFLALQMHKAVDEGLNDLEEHQICVARLVADLHRFWNTHHLEGMSGIDHAESPSLTSLMFDIVSLHFLSACDVPHLSNWAALRLS